MFDVTSGSRSGVDICREFRALPAAVGVPVMAVTTTDEVEERIAYLEAGADDVMARPFDARELEARVEALLLRFQRSRDLSPVISSDGVTMTKAKRTVAVFSPKGGVGTTTIATNIAVAAASQRPDRVVLLDYALQFGMSPRTSTSTRSRPSPTSFATTPPCASRSCCGRMPRGMRAGSMSSQHRPRPTRRRRSRAARSRLILRTALESYDFVVVDAGSTLDERTQGVFEAAETIILVVGPEIAALNAMRAMLEYVPDRSHRGQVDLRRQRAVRASDPEDEGRRGSAGSSVSLQLPYDPFLYLKAVNEGIPIVVDAPRSAPGERLVKLSQMAFGADSTAAPAITDLKRTGGMFRRRR